MYPRSRPLGTGETSVLMLARALNGTAVLDEKAARRHADDLGVKLTGSLGLMRDAIAAGWLTDNDCLAKIALLKRRGFRIPTPSADQSFADYLATLA